MKLSSILLTCLLAVAVVSCSKRNADSEVMVKMVDAPAVFTQVNVEITKVEVYHEPKSRKEQKGWKTLDTEAGTYNLLEYQNGNQASITSSTSLKTGKITGMRVTLGSNNTVETNGLLFDMMLAANASAQVEVPMEVELEAEAETEIIIDFDAAQSVLGDVQSGFTLDPDIVFLSSTSASAE